MQPRNLVIVLALHVGCETASQDIDQPVQQSEVVALRETTPEEFSQWLAGQRGKVVVVDMWATWCPPCVKEFPGLVALSKEHPRDRLCCVSLCCDYQGLGEFASVKQRVIEFLESQQAMLDNFISTADSEQLFQHLGILSVPVIDVYAADGSLHKRFDLSDGIEFTYDDVNRTVDDLLKSQTP